MSKFGLQRIPVAALFAISLPRQTTSRRLRRQPRPPPRPPLRRMHSQPQSRWVTLLLPASATRQPLQPIPRRLR